MRKRVKFSTRFCLLLDRFGEISMSKHTRPFFRRFEFNWPLISSKVRFRLARTTFPKPSLSWHPFRGFSLNTSHGARISKSFKGVTLGFQNIRFVFRGRWLSNFFGLNLNASKSGFSFSQTNFFGTYNFSNPNRSSVNILGLQFRGKKAAPWALLGFWISLPIHGLKLVAVVLQWVLQLTEIILRLVVWALQLTWLLGLFLASLLWHLFIGFICLVTPKKWING